MRAAKAASGVHKQFTINFNYAFQFVIINHVERVNQHADLTLIEMLIENIALVTKLRHFDEGSVASVHQKYLFILPVVERLEFFDLS